MTELYIPTFDHLNNSNDYPLLKCPRPYVGYYKLVYVGPACDINVLKKIEFDQQNTELVLSYFNINHYRPYLVMIPVKNPKIFYEQQEVSCINQHVTDLSKIKIIQELKSHDYEEIDTDHIHML